MRETDEQQGVNRLTRLFRTLVGRAVPEDSRIFRIKAPVQLVSDVPYTIPFGGGLKNACLPFAADVFDPEDRPCAMRALAVAQLDPDFRPKDFPPDADFKLEERFCPGVRALRPGEWVYAQFRKTPFGFVGVDFQKMDCDNIARPAFRRP